MKDTVKMIGIGIVILLFLLALSSQGVTKHDLESTEKKLSKRIEKVEKKVDRNFEQLLKAEVDRDSIKSNQDTIKSGIRVIGKILTH